MNVDAEELYTADGWHPANVMRYCSNNDLCDLSESEAYQLCETFTRCPIREFRVTEATDGEMYFVVLSNECKRFFDQGLLQGKDFLPTQVCFETDATAFDEAGECLCNVSPDYEFYHELFNEAFVRFMPR